MTSNIDLEILKNSASMAKEIKEWLGDRSHPEKYKTVAEIEQVQNFVHVIDLLETVLTRFEIQAHLAELAIKELEKSDVVGSLGWEFWTFDVEEAFATSILELGYQISNAWEKLQKFALADSAFEILQTKYRKPSKTFLARHHATHFVPEQFQKHDIAEKYSILRRPYFVKNGKLEKELAKETMPRVIELINSSIIEGDKYLRLFYSSTIGEIKA